MSLIPHRTTDGGQGGKKDKVLGEPGAVVIREVIGDCRTGTFIKGTATSQDFGVSAEDGIEDFQGDWLRQVFRCEI